MPPSGSATPEQAAHTKGQGQAAQVAETDGVGNGWKETDSVEDGV